MASIVLVEGNNVLNVQMVSIAAPAFTFSNVTAEAVICQAATVWDTVNFGCLITNPAGQPITRRLKVMWAYGDTADMIKKFTGEVGISFELTLAPGGYYDYYLAGNYQEAGEQYCHTLVAVKNFVCLWLEDEEGNKSPEGCVMR